jgi:pectate lyase
LLSTTGGGGGEVVTVSSHGELASAVGDNTPRIVLLQGTISGSDIDVGSNKTILGVGSDSGLSGFYLNMNPAQNVIIRNLTISGGTDAIAARYTTQLWIDHVDVSNCGDGLIDLTRESDMYTVSWVRFSNHHKTMLLNGGSTHSSDSGKLNGTVHHCFFDGSETRNPRAGFGKIHIFNDYNLNNGYAIGFHTESLVVAERNYFENTDDAIRQMYDEPGYESWELGDALAIDNVFDNASGDESTGIGFTVGDYYMYDFALDEANDVPAVVSAGAGPKPEYGEIGLMPIPGQGAVGVDYSTLSWATGTASPESYVVYFGTTTNPPQVATTSDTSYEAGPLSSGTVYYWRVDQVVSGTQVPGKLWTFKAQ